MLVLTRRPTESVVIDRAIYVTLLSHKHGDVRFEVKLRNDDEPKIVLLRNQGTYEFEGEKDICFTVLGIQGNQVRVGVQAPPLVSVHRFEIQQRIDAGEVRHETA